MTNGPNLMNNSVKYCLKKPNKLHWLYITGILFLVASTAAGIMLGSSVLTFSEIIRAFASGFKSSEDALILTYVRLPRTLSALVCGAALSVAGAIIQAVLSNRLASPSIIGVNSGAGLAVTLCTALGIYGGWELSLFSFLGAFLTVMLVSLGARKWNASRGTVILIGIALNSLLGAMSNAIITFAPSVGVISNDFRVGEFSSITYQRLLPAALAIIIAILVSLTLTNELDVLTLGEQTAKGLGMNTAVMQTVFLLLIALLAGCAVSIAGLLSFVGLIVPHSLRRLSVNRSLHLIALCAIYGAAFVCLCDTIARTVFTPYEIPVGIIMSFLGAPFFVFILIKGKGATNND